MRKKLTQIALLQEFFYKNSRRDIPTKEVVDWALDEWLRRTGKRFRDPDRGIRRLHQQGELVKVSKGVYRFDPDISQSLDLDNFSNAQRNQILSRDNFRCVLCGRGENEGVELHVDHIKPRKFGGKSTISNGRTLCSEHNMLKNTMSQTETGKKMFVRLSTLSKEEGHTQLESFCNDILAIYEKYGINGHIEWKQSNSD